MGGNATFLNVSKGKLVNKKKGLEYDAYYGYFKGIRLKPDSYKGEPKTQVQVRMMDEKKQENVIVCFNLESWFCIGFFQRIEKIDLAEPFLLGVFTSDKIPEGASEPSTVPFCYMKQGPNLKSESAKIVKREDFPRPEKVNIGKGKTASNYDKVEVEVKNVMNRLAERMGIKVEEIDERAQPPQHEGPPPHTDTDLPF